MIDFVTAPFSLLDAAWLSAVWPMLAGTALKGVLLLAAGALCAWGVQRRTSASARHLVWTLALLGTLALPVATAVGPSWEARVPRSAVPSVLLAGPSSAASTSGQPERAARSPSGAVESGQASNAPRGSRLTSKGEETSKTKTRAGRASSASNARERVPTRRAGASGIPNVPLGATQPGGRALREWSWAAGLVLLWLAGLLAASLRLLVGAFRAWCLARRSEQMPGEERALLGGAQEALPTWRRVRVRFAEGLATPLTWGAFRPLVVLPKEATTRWSEERRRGALLHELAHVRRFDALTQSWRSSPARSTGSTRWPGMPQGECAPNGSMPATTARSPVGVPRRRPPTRKRS